MRSGLSSGQSISQDQGHLSAAILGPEYVGLFIERVERKTRKDNTVLAFLTSAELA
jgi:hypothetical protein